MSKDSVFDGVEWLIHSPPKLGPLIQENEHFSISLGVYLEKSKTIGTKILVRRLGRRSNFTIGHSLLDILRFSSARIGQ